VRHELVAHRRHSRSTEFSSSSSSGLDTTADAHAAFVALKKASEALRDQPFLAPKVFAMNSF
jgi:hypothetical protein